MRWFLGWPEGKPEGEQLRTGPHLSQYNLEIVEISLDQYECMKKVVWG